MGECLQGSDLSLGVSLVIEDLWGRYAPSADGLGFKVADQEAVSTKSAYQ